MSKFKINKNAGHEFSTGERVNWLDRFADKLAREEQKSAVEVARERSNQTLYEQISSIISGGSGQGSVESKVQDLQERVGLKEYLRRLSTKNTKVKVASDLSASLPEVPEELKNKIETFCKNKIETYKGFVSVLAMQEEILSAFRGQVDPQDINDKRVATAINNMIAEERERNPKTDVHDTNLGRGVGIQLDDDDGENEDFFNALMPNTRD